MLDKAKPPTIVIPSGCRSSFSPAETRILETMDATSRSTAFLDGWVRKEAVLKAHGAGLSWPLHDLEVPLGREAGPSTVRIAHPADGGIMHWHIRDVPVGAGRVAALAASKALRRVSVRDWSTGA